MPPALCKGYPGLHLPSRPRKETSSLNSSQASLSTFRQRQAALGRRSLRLQPTGGQHAGHCCLDASHLQRGLRPAPSSGANTQLCPVGLPSPHAPPGSDWSTPLAPRKQLSECFGRGALAQQARRAGALGGQGRPPHSTAFQGAAAAVQGTAPTLAQTMVAGVHTSPLPGHHRQRSPRSRQGPPEPQLRRQRQGQTFPSLPPAPPPPPSRSSIANPQAAPTAS